MTRPVRAYLMTRTSSGEWDVSVCRDLEAVLERWSSRTDHNLTSVLHLGFDRPPTVDFEAVAAHYPSRFLLTAAAKYGMPSGYESSSRPVGHVNALPIFLGIRGFGYSVDDSAIDSPAEVSPAERKLSVAPTGWVSSFLITEPEYVDVFRALDVFDDISYVAREVDLPLDVRRKSGDFRFRIL